ncbi:MAG TPA: ATP synthase F1 subunit delta [Candidatus Baltobacteraceae bacterium]
MSTQTVSRRYATAIFELASEGGLLDGTAADLQVVAAAIERDADVQRFFASPVVDRGLKGELFARVFSAKVGTIAQNTLALLIRKRREALLAPIVEEFNKLVLAAKALEPLAIVSARPIEPGELEGMVEHLSSVYRKRFDLDATVDPSLLGGVRIRMSDRYIDGSIAGRLDELARELANRRNDSAPPHHD